MKARLLTTAFVYAFCMTVQAQTLQVEYQPFVEEGKVWDKQVGGTKENTFSNYIDGDTLINGETWKKVYNHAGFGYPGYFYYAALREEGKKVYAIAKGGDTPRLIYDFDLKVGDELKCGVEGSAFGCLRDRSENPDTLLGFPFRKSLKVKSIDTIHVSGPYVRESYLRRFHFYLLDAFGVPETRREVVWVEGIGSVMGPFQPWETVQIPGEDIMVLHCEVDRESIFGFYIHEMTTVSSPQYQHAESRVVHDLQGRRISGLPQKGIYIQNGKKKLMK